MSTSNNQNFDNQEIDLSLLSNRISGFVKSINRRVFLFFRYLLKNIIIFGTLVVLGVGVGYYLDKNQKTYKNSIITRPNFDSTDYLYSKIELLNTKIKDNDTLFLKSIGIHDPSKLMNIEVTPVIDVYKFISSTTTEKNDPNFQLLKLMAEDGDINTIIKDNVTSKNYSYHKISFNTKAKVSRKEVVEPLLNYLDSSQHYLSIQIVQVDNMKNRVTENMKIITQIDEILAGFNNKKSEIPGKEKLIYYNENVQLNDLVNTKSYLISQNANIRLELENIKNIVKEQSTVLNIRNTKSINGKLKFVLPLLLVFMYLLTTFFIKFYKRQSALYGK